MNEIKSAAIIGAGALGLMYMPSLQRVLGEGAYFLATEDRYDRLVRSEFVINGQSCSMAVKKPQDLTEKPDLIMVAVKNYHLEGIAPLLQRAAGPGTVIVSVLNGIESEDFLKKTCPQSHILYCAVLGMDAVKVGSSLNYTSMGKFLIGAENNDKQDRALSVFTRFLDRTGFVYAVPSDIHREIWYKWMINIGINQVSAVSGATYGAFQTQKETHDLMTDAMKETMQVARAAKIDLKEDDLVSWEKVLHSLGPDGKTSMLQDMEAQRRTEIDSFAGKLISLARSYNLSVPVNVTLFRLIRTMEQLYTDD
jgi:2-dehydropantoate 2-reductase